MLTLRILPALVGFLCAVGALRGLETGNWVQQVICVALFIPCAIVMAKNAKLMMEDIRSWTGLTHNGDDTDHTRRSASEMSLIQAVMSGDEKAVRDLLDRGGDPNTAVKGSGHTLLMLSVPGPIELARLLIQRGADVNAKSNDGQTALMRAVAASEIEVASLLLDCGANIEAVDRHGQTALAWAIHVEEVDALRLLLKRGANSRAKDFSGRSVHALAEEIGNPGIIEELNT
jgi:ankyrin repeat protein